MIEINLNNLKIEECGFFSFLCGNRSEKGVVSSLIPVTLSI